jgi:hypothetical protein
MVAGVTRTGETTDQNAINDLQEKVIGAVRFTLQETVTAIGDGFQKVTARDGQDDTFNSPKYATVTAYGLTEGVDMTQAQQITDSNVAISASEVGVQVVPTRKALRTVGTDKMLRDLGRIMASSVIVKQETDFATLIDGFGNIVGADGSAATIGQMRAGIAQIRANSEPQTDLSGVRVVIHPYTWHDMSDAGRPLNLTSGVFPGEGTAETFREKTMPAVATVDGVPVHLTTNLVTSSTNVRNGIYHRDSALIYIFEAEHLDPEYDASGRWTELNLVVDYGYGELNDGFGREWDADITAPTS